MPSELTKGLAIVLFFSSVLSALSCLPTSCNVEQPDTNPTINRAMKEGFMLHRTLLPPPKVRKLELPAGGGAGQVEFREVQSGNP